MFGASSLKSVLENVGFQDVELLVPARLKDHNYVFNQSWMIEQGLAIKLIEDFDYADFAARGGEYLIERYGEEVGRSQIDHSDVELERGISRRFAGMAPIERRIADIGDLRNELARGAVVIVNINAAPLYGTEGYSGHFVVVCDIGDDWIEIHDPGMPPKPNLRVPLERFTAAWAYPTPRDKNLLSISSPS